MPTDSGERSLGELFGDLSRETSTLVRQEVTLAKAELTQTATHVGKDVGVLAVGGAIAYAGLLALLAAVVLGLVAFGLPAWLAALIVGVVVAGGGYALVRRGLSALKGVDMAPRQTMETLTEDVNALKGNKR
jgi:hypothetical protein